MLCGILDGGEDAAQPSRPEYADAMALPVARAR
jgi:hypothetical protein